jgi:hypothetical protein
MEKPEKIKKSQLRVNNPCHENWDNMSPAEQGKFCGVCETEVVDFVAMSDEQVEQFFANYQGGHLCGRIRQKEELPPISISTAVLPPQFQPSHWRKIAAGLLLATSLAACKSKPHSHEVEKVGEMEIMGRHAPQPDSLKIGEIKEVIVMGKPAMPSQTTVTKLLKGDGLKGEVTKNGQPKAYANVALYDGDEILVKTQTKADGLFSLKLPDFNPAKHKNLRIEASHMEFFEVSHNATVEQIIPQPLKLELGEPTFRKGKIRID